jgi:hypothetical protein
MIVETGNEVVNESCWSNLTGLIFDLLALVLGKVLGRG